MSWVQIPSPTPPFQSHTSVRKARVGRFGKTWVKNCGLWRTLKTQVVAELLAHSTLFRQYDARSRLHRSLETTGTGSLHSDSPNHCWNRPFQGCVRRRPDVHRDDRPGLGRRLKQPRLFCGYGRIYGNCFRSADRGRTKRTISRVSSTIISLKWVTGTTL